MVNRSVDTNYLSNLFLRELRKRSAELLVFMKNQPARHDIAIGAAANQVGR